MTSRSSKASPSAVRDGFDLAGPPLAIATALACGVAGALTLGATGAAYADTATLVLCPLRAATGMPCPLCGMTHALFAAGSGDLAAAVTLSPTIPLIILTAAVLLVAAPGRLRARRPLLVPLWLGAGLVAVVLGAWLLRLTGVVPALPD